MSNNCGQPPIYPNFIPDSIIGGVFTFKCFNNIFRNYKTTAGANFALDVLNVRNGGSYYLLVTKTIAPDVVITLPVGSVVIGDFGANTITLQGAANEHFLIRISHDGTNYVFEQVGGGGQVAPGVATGFSPNVVPFIDGTGNWAEDALFSYDGAANQLITKYSKTEVVEFKNSGYLKVYNYGVGGADTTQLVILGKNIGGQTALSTPTGLDLTGGVLIGNNIIPGFTSNYLGARSVLIGNNIFTGFVGVVDTSIMVAIGTDIGGTGAQNQSVVIGTEALSLSSAPSSYNAYGGHKNTYIGYRVAQQANHGLNVAFGCNALSSLVDGNSNVAIGFNAGNSANANNSGAGIGYNFSSSIFVGRGAHTNGAWSNSIALGSNIQIFQSNMMTIGNLIYGTGMTPVSNQTVSPGLVGVGLNNPSARLHIKSESAINGSYAFKVETSIFTVMEIENNATVRLCGDTMFGVNTDVPQAKVDIYSVNGYEQFRLRTQYTPSSNMDANGAIGSIWFDDDYMYRKTSTGEIKRVQLTIF